MVEDLVHIVLYKPEIPYNTGNIIRLCANVGAQLHLIHPLGFDLSESKLRRAALDYSDLAVVTEHEDYQAYLNKFPNRRIFATSAWSKNFYTEHEYGDNDSFLFGPESAGLPEEIVKTIPEERRILIPMASGNRSLNIANSVSVIAYESWRQRGFEGAGPQRK